jgi:transposase
MLTRQRTRQVNRIKGLLALHGVALPRLRGLPATPPALQDWSGAPLPPALTARLGREWARLRATQREVLALRAERRRLLAAPDAGTDPTLRMVDQLLALRGIGEVSAWLYTTEFFGWRAFRNRRQVAGAAGLTPTTQASGDTEHEQGISKAGNAMIRALAIELAWSWVRRQPTSTLSRWYRARYSAGGARQRRVGIVAVARKLLIALWRYLDTGLLPEAPCSKPNVPPRVLHPLVRRARRCSGSASEIASERGAVRSEGAARRVGTAREGCRPTCLHVSPSLVPGPRAVRARASRHG